MNLREAAELAIEALMGLDSYKRAEAIIELRKALHEGVVQEFKLYDDGVNTGQKCVDKTAKCEHGEQT